MASNGLSQYEIVLDICVYTECRREARREGGPDVLSPAFFDSLGVRNSYTDNSTVVLELREKAFCDKSAVRAAGAAIGIALRGRAPRHAAPGGRNTTMNTLPTNEHEDDGALLLLDSESTLAGRDLLASPGPEALLVSPFPPYPPPWWAQPPPSASPDVATSPPPLSSPPPRSVPSPTFAPPPVSAPSPDTRSRAAPSPPSSQTSSNGTSIAQITAKKDSTTTVVGASTPIGQKAIDESAENSLFSSFADADTSVFEMAMPIAAGAFVLTVFVMMLHKRSRRAHARPIVVTCGNPVLSGNISSSDASAAASGLGYNMELNPAAAAAAAGGSIK